MLKSAWKWFIVLLISWTGVSADSDCPLTVQWVKKFGGSAWDYTRNVATFPDGRFVVVGSFASTATFAGSSQSYTASGTSDAYAASFQPDGTLEWVRTWGGGGEDKATGVAAHADGSCTICGDFSGTITFGAGEAAPVSFSAQGNADGWIARFGPSGAFQWAEHVGGTSEEMCHWLAATPDGGVFAVGYHIYSGAVFASGKPNQTLHEASGSFVARYGPDGALVWTRLLGGDSQSNALGVCTTPDGDCAVAGYFFGTSRFESSGGSYVTLSSSGQGDIFVARYAPDGQLRWVRGDGGTDHDTGWGINAFSDGSLAVSGAYTGSAIFGRGGPRETNLMSAGGRDIWTARYYADGSLAWAKGCGEGTYPEELGIHTAVLRDDSCVVTGEFYGSSTFGRGDPNATVVASRGGVEAFVSRYDIDGGFLCVHPFGGSSHDMGYSVIPTADDALLVTGFFSGTAEFGTDSSGSPVAVTVAGGRDGFLVKYTISGLPVPNTPPEADAGEALTIRTSEQSSTVIHGTATDSEGGGLTYRWLEGATVLVGPLPVAGSDAPLNLGGLPSLPIGDHVLTLEVSDGALLATDSMCLTVDNSPPVAAPTGGGVLEIGPDKAVALGGSVADHDGDVLTIEWRRGSTLLFGPDTVLAPLGGSPIAIPPRNLPTQTLGVGVHTLTLVVSDETNAEVTSSICVEIVDGTAPALRPVPSATILWPPNHQMVPITIEANATDNSGGAVALSVSVASSQPADALGDGSFLPDYAISEVDSASGRIGLSLRSERAGRGDGRVYTITITATDSAGNSSTATVQIVAPRDRKPR